jgi:hypothetical protein
MLWDDMFRYQAAFMSGFFEGLFPMPNAEQQVPAVTEAFPVAYNARAMDTYAFWVHARKLRNAPSDAWLGGAENALVDLHRRTLFPSIRARIEEMARAAYRREAQP